MDKHRKTLIFSCLLISIVSMFFIAFSQKPSKNTTVNTQKTSQPFPVVRAQEPRLTSVISPDGKFILTMRENNGKDTTTYSFVVKDEKAGVQKEIYNKVEAAGTTLSVPANTFSSDNKYVFLKETSSSQTSFIVLAASGAPIRQDVQTVDFSSLFTAKYTDYKITDATGWGGPTLVVINTDKSGGGAGPSFWFDVSSLSFIQLSTRFN